MSSKETAQRFFYHSFLAHVRMRRWTRGVARAQGILESMVEIGLLLTPEGTQWRERLEAGGLGPRVDLWQKRVCLTELRPPELAGHATHFGPFALEFGLEEFLQMGGMPVFYLPAVPMTYEEVRASAERS